MSFSRCVGLNLRKPPQEKHRNSIAPSSPLDSPSKVPFYPRNLSPPLCNYLPKGPISRCPCRINGGASASLFASFTRMFMPLRLVQLVKGEPAENISTYRLQNVHGRRWPRGAKREREREREPRWLPLFRLALPRRSARLSYRLLPVVKPYRSKPSLSHSGALRSAKRQPLYRLRLCAHSLFERRLSQPPARFYHIAEAWITRLLFEIYTRTVVTFLLILNLCYRPICICLIIVYVWLNMRLHRSADIDSRVFGIGIALIRAMLI